MYGRKAHSNMTSRERTAYPRFKPVVTDRDLYDLYTPTEDELQFIKPATTQEPVLPILARALEIVFA
jgi:hypothetical protein